MKTATKALYLGLVTFICLFFADARTQADTIYVGNIGENTIIKFDSRGVRSVFADDSSGLIQTHGMAVDRNGNLYAGSGANILRYDPSGHVSGFASGVASPQGVASDSRDNIYVANGWPFQVFKINPSGNKSVFISSGLDNPSGMAFDSSGNFYVANSWGIEKFDLSGNGTVFATGLSPIGLAFDIHDNLYAADMDGEKIVKFDSSGNRSIFASVPIPRGLAIDSNGDLYVACMSAGIIEKFDSAGHGSVFASGLHDPWSIAIQVPEPATWSLLALGVGALLGGWRLCPRKPTRNS